MRPGTAVRTIAAVLGNWQYLRFPTLTRPMIDPAPLPVEIGGHHCDLGDDFLARVQSCYRAATETSDARASTIWQAMESRNRSFIDALRSGSPASLRPHLETLYAGDLLMGMGHVQAFVTGRKTIYPKPYFSMRVRDATMALGEALGLRGPPSNQQTPLATYRRLLRADLGPLIDEIEAELGFRIDVPQVGCPPAVRIGARRYNPDTIRHALIARRLSEFGIGTTSPVLEIGGGYGVVARYGVLAGYRAWTIVDLPYVNAIQMLWLGATLGPERVSGYGERPASVHLHPSTDKAGLAHDFAMALNMDSLPEIEEEEARAYIDLIEGHSRRFLSINQEARATPRGGLPQNSVPELMSGRRMRRVSRHPYWMEQGYVEELYERID